MKKVLILIATFLLITCLAISINDVLNIALTCSASGSSIYKTQRLFVHSPSGELPILGSSRAQAHFIPSLIAPEAFNYGIDGSEMYETLFFLTQALQNPSSKPIIINLDPWGFKGVYSKKLIADYTLAVSNPSVRHTCIEESILPPEYWPGIRFYGTFRNNLAQWLNTRKSITKQVDSGAVLLRISRTAKEWDFINSTIQPHGFNLDASWIPHLETIFAQTTRPLIWVVGPCSPQWRAHFSGENALRNFLAYLKQYPCNTVIDLYTPTDEWTEAAFVDPTHLNIQGATRFTQLFLEMLPPNLLQ